MEELITILIDKSTIKLKKNELAEFIYTESNILSLIESSISFFCLAEKDYWHPMMIDYRDALPAINPHISDPLLKDLCNQVSQGRIALKTINLELFNFLSNYWTLENKNNLPDFDKIARKRSKIKKGEPVPWLADDSFINLREKLATLKREMVAINQNILNSLILNYDFKSIVDFGDDRAKDLIDRSYTAKPKKSLQYLEKAISYGHPTFMSYKAHSSIGDIHKQFGDFKSAAESYSVAMEHLEQSTINMSLSGNMRVNFLRRGLCYAALNEIELALQDFQKAFDSIDPEKLFSSDELGYVEALEFIKSHS